MGMGLGAMQVFEKLRAAATRARNRAFAGKQAMQTTPAAVDDVFDVLEDVDRRLQELEKERDARGIVVVGDPSQGLVDFVRSHIDDMSTRDVPAAAIRAIMGRVLFVVEKTRKEYESEMRGAMENQRVRGTVKDNEWLVECQTGVEVSKKIEERLRALLAEQR